MGRGNAVAWLALIIGILALILAWSAYNRSGADLEDQVDNVVDEAANDFDNQVDEAINDVVTGTTSTSTVSQ